MADERAEQPNSWGQMRSRPVDLGIRAEAEPRDGLIDRDQLLELGLTPKNIEYRLRIGRLIAIHRGVYAVGHSAITRKARLRAATMIAPDIGLSHHSAAEWWALVSPRSGNVHVTCPR